MSSDFGAKTPRRSNPVAMVVPVLVIALIVAGGGGLWLMQQKSKAAEASAWHMAGPPCVTATQAGYAQMAGEAQPHVVEIDGIKMARASGQADCGEAPNLSGRGSGPIPVCTFTDPTSLDVTVGARHFYFLPRSEPATVSIADGKPSCVLTGGAAG